MDIRFKHPATYIIAGSSMTGKTRFCFDLIKSGMMDADIEDIVVCYTEWQEAYEQMKDCCRFVRGMIDPDDLDARVPHIVILDDMLQADESNRLEQFFVRSAHHRNCSVFYITQNLFSQGRGHRTCSLNAQHIILMKSPRSVAQLKVLQGQVFPGSKNFLLECYADACRNPFTHLLLDLRPDTPDYLRVRGRILDQDSQDVYVPNEFKLSDIIPMTSVDRHGP